MAFTPDQQLAIDSIDGAYCLLSGPGSGKTTVLAARVQKIIDSGVRPSDILCLTFTREAADAMLQRTGGKKQSFRTFHSFGYDVVTRELGDQPIEPEKRNRLLAGLSKKWRVDYKELAQYISTMRHKNVSPADALDNDEWRYGLPRAYGEYEAERKKGGWIDFDSMICDTRNLLEKPEIRERYQFRYVLADECQDTDSAQFRILQLITEKYGNIMCIGDPAQALYGFRGAEPDNLLKFEKWFPGGRYIYLGRNFRSTATITDFVRENYPIITSLKDKLLPHRTEKGVPIEYKQHTNDWNEAEDALAIANADPENTAILARTNRLLLPLQTLALEHNIRYRLLGRSGFWQQREIQKAIKKLTELGTTPVLWALDTFLGHMMSTYQTDDSTPEDNDAVDNLRSLRKIAEKRGGSARDFAAYGNRCAQVKRRDGVAFGTIHSSKGLEFKTVIIIGAEQGVIPHKRGDNAEERRIWFVGISRAKDRLRLSWTFYPSPFIKLTEAEHQALAARAYEKEKIQKQVSLF